MFIYHYIKKSKCIDIVGGFMKTCEGRREPSSNVLNFNQGELKKILSLIPNEEELYNKSKIFKALSDPTRLEILYLLQQGELCVCKITAALEKPQPTISHHLNVLKNVGFIKWRKEGVWIHYRLSNKNIINLVDKLCESL